MGPNINLREAAVDLRYLLNRSFNRKSSIEFVGDKWNLTREERHILYRAIFSTGEIRNRQWNEITIEEIKDKSIAIDTYNILITIESCLKGLTLIKADDQYIRDISKIFDKYRQSTYTLKAVHLILTTLKPYKPKEILFFLDKNISHSGDLATLINEQLAQFELKGIAQPVPCSDRAVVDNGEVVISNDRVVLENGMTHFNLVALLVQNIAAPHMKLIEIK